MYLKEFALLNDEIMVFTPKVNTKTPLSIIKSEKMIRDEQQNYGERGAFVLKVGPMVTDVSPGDRVMLLPNTDGLSYSVSDFEYTNEYNNVFITTRNACWGIVKGDAIMLKDFLIANEPAPKDQEALVGMSNVKEN